MCIASMYMPTRVPMRTYSGTDFEHSRAGGKDTRRNNLHELKEFLTVSLLPTALCSKTCSSIW